MIDVVMLRHAVTAWNESGRIQGRTDVPLCVGRWLGEAVVEHGR